MEVNFKSNGQFDEKLSKLIFNKNLIPLPWLIEDVSQSVSQSVSQFYCRALCQNTEDGSYSKGIVPYVEILD